jgi:hypothetical protein
VSILVCSLCEAMIGSLPVFITAVSSTEVNVVDSGEIGRSAVYRSYISGPRTLHWFTPALTGERSVKSF